MQMILPILAMLEARMLQPWRRAGLQVRLLIQAAVALGVIVLAFVAISIQALNSSTHDAMQERLVLARVMAHQVDVHLDHAVEMLRGALKSDEMDLQDGSLAAEKKLLKTIHEQSALFTRVLLLDLHGTVLWAEPYDDRMVGVNLLAPPYSVPAPQPGASSFFWRRIAISTQKPGVVVRLPIQNHQNEPTGYLFGWIDMSNPLASSLLYPYRPGSNGYADLIDEQGVVLASTEEERVGLLSDHAGRLNSLIKEDRPAVGGCHSCHDPNGVEHKNDVLAFAPLESVPWGIVLRQPEAEILALTHSLAYKLASLGIMVLAAFVGLVWLTTRGIVVPLQLLADACRRIASGDLSHSVPSMGVAETSTLASSFEDMRQRLIRYRTEMANQHKELERRVEERTAELAISHHQLEQSRDYLLRTNRNLTALNSIAAIVGRSLKLEDVLGAALDRVLEAMAVEIGGVLLRDEQRGGLLLAAHRGVPEDVVPDIERCANSQLFAQETPPMDGGSWNEALAHEVGRRLEVRSLLSVPLEARGQILGCLFVASVRDGLLGLDDDVTLLHSIGWQVAVAVRNVFSYSTLKQEEQARGDLLHRILGAQEEERKRIARELHDETCQSITALILGLDTTRLALTLSPEEAMSRLDGTKAMAAGILENIRRLVADLRPSLLDDLGLVPAIVWYGDQRLKPLGIDLDLETSGLQQRLPPTIETALFRVVQEAISNVVKHAQASSVSITLQRLGGQVDLSVKDNGRGIQLPHVGPAGTDGYGLGLRGMKERAADLGGTLTLHSEPYLGTQVIVSIPIPEEAPYGKDPSAVGR
jgi:signal transduction histidine kinase